jgi:hypothetical protein
LFAGKCDHDYIQSRMSKVGRPMSAMAAMIRSGWRWRHITTTAVSLSTTIFVVL